MAALRRDGGQIASELEGALANGGAGAAQAINQAGTTGGQAFGNEAGSAFSRMLDGLAAQFGVKAAASFRQNVGTVGGGSLSPASGVRGRTMPDAGTTPARP